MDLGTLDRLRGPRRMCGSQARSPATGQKRIHGAQAARQNSCCNKCAHLQTAAPRGSLGPHRRRIPQSSKRSTNALRPGARACGLDFDGAALERSRETLLSVSVNEPSSGFHQLDLAKHNITLQPGMAYRFSIALVIDPENRSRDVFASGVIIRTNLAPSLEQKLHPAIHEERPFFCAEAGLWYDALESLANLIAAQPANPHFLEQRDALLNQVGLTNVVRCEANLVAKPSE